MKILLVSDKPPWPGSSGGALAVKACIEGFVRRGENITVFATSTRKHRLSDENTTDGIMNSIKFISVNINTGINIFTLIINLLFSSLPYNIQRFRSGRVKNKLKEILKKEEFDIVQIEGLNMTVYIPLIKQYSQAMISLRAHNIEHEIWNELSGGEKNNLKRFYLKLISSRMKDYEMKTINKCDLLIPISENDSRFFLQSGVEIPAYTCPFGIDIKPVQKKAEHGKSGLSYIGSLDWRPNQEGLIWFLNTVWPKVLLELPEFELHIAGRNAPDWLIKKLNTKGVRFFGEVADAKEFIKEANILIVPLLSGSGIRIRIIQAMAVGTPVISTIKGIKGIDARDGKDILLANTAGEYCDQIIKLAGDGNLQNKLTENATELINNYYNINEIYTGLLNFYSKQIK